MPISFRYMRTGSSMLMPSVTEVVDVDALGDGEDGLHLGDLLVDVLGDLYLLHHVDVLLLDGLVELLHGLLVQLQLLERVHDLLVAQYALLLARFQQLVDPLLGVLGGGGLLVGFAHIRLLIFWPVSGL